MIMSNTCLKTWFLLMFMQVRALAPGVCEAALPARTIQETATDSEPINGCSIEVQQPHRA
jgi:hypothetical protein